jgi:hypothetical protein
MTVPQKFAVIYRDGVFIAVQIYTYEFPRLVDIL